MTGLPAWVGWPGSGPAPGHDWLPGPVLRFVILAATYAFIALALTVNYAYSTTFFLLALLGMYVGLRRGFVNRLTRAERLVMLAFAAYVGVAIASFLLGMQTNVGFRFLGRDLRFLLFIPVYLSIRWSRPQRTHVVLALTGSAIGAYIMAFLQRNPWPLPQGVTGTHIVFGDLAMLSGLLAAALFWTPKKNPDFLGVGRWKWVIILIAIGAGLAASILAKAGGAWLAVPVLIGIFAVAAPFVWPSQKFLPFCLVASVLIIVIASMWFLPPVKDRVERTLHNLTAYAIAGNSRAINAKCIDQENLLQLLLRASYSSGINSLKVVKLTKKTRNELQKFGCRGNYAIRLVNSASNKKIAAMGLYRGRGPTHNRFQSATILALGSARFNVGWKGQWVQIKNMKKWGKYTAIGQESQIRSAIFNVLPGHQILFIPIQEQRGAFIYPLITSSVARRLAMWQEAWSLFLENPWTGAGTGAFHDEVISNTRSQIVGNYEHAHSDYFTSMGTKGIIGLFSLILLLGILPIALSKNSMRIMGNKWDAALFSAIIFSVGFFIFGLTETMFIHSLVISWYTVVAASILAMGKTSH